jgi:intracellular sulfur oxidation DsrE/DsrF family protein
MEPVDSSQRRSFLSRLNTGAAALAAFAVGRAANAQTKTAAAKFEPMRHEKDDWLDELPGKHRLVFDTTNADGVSNALRFANNFKRVNRSDYGLQDSDSAVVIVVRHRSAAFGYNDAMWAKYGEAIAKRITYEDPKTHAAPKTNPFNTASNGDGSPDSATTLDSLAKQGVQLAVCASATRAIAAAITKATGGETDAIFAELGANLVNRNARLVPAGIVAVNRAQERGYSLAVAG